MDLKWIINFNSAGHDPASAKNKDPLSVIALNRAEWHGTTTRMCVCVYVCKNTIF